MTPEILVSSSGTWWKLTIFLEVRCGDVLRLWVPLFVFAGCRLRCSNGKKWDDHQKKKFFINNSVEYLSPFKEQYQDLLIFFPVLVLGEKSPKKKYLWSRKNDMWRNFSDQLKICLSCGLRSEKSSEEKMRRQQKKKEVL